MALTNGYATLDQLKLLKDIKDVDALDDAFLEELITQASRMIDAICGRWFYSYTGTRYYDVPDGRELMLDEDLLTITTLTNGDTTVITSTYYQLLPLNSSPKYCIRLKQSTTYNWETDSSNNSEGVISVAGTWGFVSRTATDPESARVVENTRRACLMICKGWLDERFGMNTGGNTYITAAGVVQTPAGAIPKAAYDIIKPYIRII